MHKSLAKKELTDSLSALRKRIDVLDHELIKLINERILLATKAAAFKKMPNQIKDVEREQEIINMALERACAIGLDKKLTAEFYHLLLLYSRDAVKRAFEQNILSERNDQAS